MTVPIRNILEYARLAPSVHNTQPWRFAATDSNISLFVEPKRTLDAGDPTTRELWVSLGICLEAIFQAAKGLGFTAHINLLQTETTTKEIAGLSFTKASKPQPDILELLKNRHSHRGPMHTIALPPSLIATWQQTIKDLPDTSIIFVNDPDHMKHVAEITEKGMRLALSSAKFRKELVPLLHYNWSKARIGLHGYVLNHGMLGSIWEKWSVRLGVDSKHKALVDKQKILEASGLLFITSKGDVPPFWLNVGRAYMRVALEITRAGLAHSTLTAPIEAARFHEDIEFMLGTNDRIQSMIRIGKAARPIGRTSPRLSVEELLT